MRSKQHKTNTNGSPLFFKSESNIEENIQNNQRVINASEKDGKDVEKSQFDDTGFDQLGSYTKEEIEKLSEKIVSIGGNACNPF